MAAGISSAVYIFCWNGSFTRLGDQGMYGLPINGALVVAMIVARRADVAT